MTDVRIRPMRPDDVPEAERISDEGFFELDSRMHRAAWPAPARRSASHSDTWRRRTLHLIGTDPGGCWAAEDGDRLVGFATSFTRELMWCLATYAVRPGLQGRGIGRPLLAAALDHGRGCLRGMLSSSSDTRAVRLYHQAGFELHPQMFLTGTVDRSTIPAGIDAKVRAGTTADLEQMDSIDRAVRGAAHGPDHVVMSEAWRLLVSDTTTGSGYAYLTEKGSVALLAATNRRTATRLLWTALADAPGEVFLNHVTGANQWALDVGLAARLELHQDGYLGLRGMKPPAPYVHNGALL